MNQKAKGDLSKIVYLYILIITISLLASAMLLFRNNIASGYELLWLLPLSFCIASIFNFKIFNHFLNDIIVFILLIGYFIRCVITPVLIALGEYKLMFETLTYYNIKKGILLMSYEVIFVFFMTNLFLKIIIKKNKFKDLNKLSKIEKIKTSSFNGTILWILTIFILIIAIVIPEIRDSFTTIFSGGMEVATVDYDILKIAVRGSLQRILLTLFVFIFDIIRFIIPVYLIRIIYKNMKDSSISYILSTIISVMPFMFITGSSIQPFTSLIINIAIMKKLYPRLTKKMIKIYIIFGAIILIIVLGNKLTLLSNARDIFGISSVALTFNAYFPGIGNTAAALNIPKDSRLLIMFYDLFSSIPFRYSLFPSISANELRLSDLFRIYSGRGNQIIPTINGAYYYFGFICAPLLPTMLSYLAIKMKQKAECTMSYWYYFYFLFFSLKISMIPNMYTHITIVQTTINLFLPLYILIRISHGKNVTYDNI